MTRKAKLYLSKSNACRSQNVNEFMAAIRALDVTYNEPATGVQYAHTQMLGNDYILILPPNPGGDFVGRGQYEQIKFALDKGLDVLFVNEIYLDDENGYPIYKIKVSDVHDIDVYDVNDWTVCYGQVDHNEGWIDLYNYDGILPKKQPKVYDSVTLKPVDSAEISPKSSKTYVVDASGSHAGLTFNEAVKKLGYGKRKRRLSIIKLLL